ncbi:MAG: hypothetical protein JWM21_3864 [Acidobacteria bacterium]|nr:hypothetical protein [Acidobacteriota bacterium]
MTFSLLGFDEATRSIGICSVTSSPAHGQRCPHFLKGVGVVTTQGMSNRYHGENCIKLLSLGLSPEECLAATRENDTNIECRQIAIIDGNGERAAFTGSATKDFKGHLAGADFIAAGNVLTGEEVLGAMSEGFQTASGELADRLLAGCAAGDKAGGELGGSYSCFLIVVRPDQPQPWGAYVDIRIDYSPDVVNVMRKALDEYRKWEKPRLQDAQYSLDSSLPGAYFTEDER